MDNSAMNVIERAHPNIDSVFNKQSKYALQLRTSSLFERKAILKKLLDAIEHYTPDFIEAAAKDFNKPETEMLMTEILAVVHEIKHTMKHMAKWMKPKPVAVTRLTLGTRSKIVYEPKGVCLIISPWNYPVNLTFVPLVSALAAGNTAIIKPSELTPHLSCVIAKVVKEVFDEMHVAVFEGDIAVSLQLLKKPFDHIFFTGSPQVGKSVMAAAAKNLASVTLELGGKSPVIVDQTVKISTTAAKIVWGKFLNNGQTCIAPDYILVHESIIDAFVTEMKVAITAAYGNDIRNNKDRCSVVNSQHTRRIKALLDDAIKKGGQLVLGGDIDIEARYISPTLVIGDRKDKTFLNSRLMQEEIFGPVLPIMTYRDLTEAISHINSRHKPLALYVYSNNSQTVNKVLDRTSSGGTCINTNMLHYMHGNLPFGGVNNSGLGGSSHGQFGFRTFSHERAVLEDKFTLNHLLYPPYSARIKKIAQFLIKYVS